LFYTNLLFYFYQKSIFTDYLATNAILIILTINFDDFVISLPLFS